MLDYNHVNMRMECGVKLSKEEKGVQKVDQTLFRSLVGSLRYLTDTKTNILFSVGLVRRYMENSSKTHMKAAKRLLHYLKDTRVWYILFSLR